MRNVKNLISMRTAADMIDRYIEFSRNSKEVNFKPVLSIQFSSKELENYLRYVKSLSRLKGVKVSGIQVVNAIYPSNHADKAKQNKHTVLFIPTYRCNGKEKPFDPLYIKDGEPEDLRKLLENAGGHTPPHHDIDEDDDNPVVFSYANQEMESSFMNFGGLGEPPSGGN